MSTEKMMDLSANSSTRSVWCCLCVAALMLSAVFNTNVVFGSAQTTINPFTIPQGAYTAEYLEDHNFVTIMRFAGNYDSELEGGAFNAPARAVVAQEFFEHHPDKYDFLVVFTSFEFESGEALAFYHGVKNDVQGIGRPQSDNTVLYGSDGRLQGFIDMAATSRYELNPFKPEFENVLNIMAHETLHNWGISVDYIDESGERNDALRGSDDAHWNFFLETNASVEYGHRWQDNGDGSFTAVAARRFFSPLDLYLMGFYTKDQVPPMSLIEPNDDTFSPLDLPSPGVTVSGSVKTISIDNIIAAEGPRIPAAAESQKEFRFGFIYLVAPGEEIDELALARIGSVRKAFADRFAILTGGQGVAQIFPEALPVAQVGEATSVQSEGELITGDASVEQALEWIRAQQTLEGFWADNPSTQVRDTAVALETLRLYDRASFVRGAEAVAWLSSQSLEDADSLARAIKVLNNTDNVLLNRVIDSQNKDDGWGLYSDLPSSVLDTAITVTGTVDAGAGAINLHRAFEFWFAGAIEYLLTQQNNEGSWSVSTESTAGDLLSSVETLLALAEADQTDELQAAIDLGLNWLVAQQNSDGSFGDTDGSVHMTAKVLVLFNQLGRADQIQAVDAIDYIRNRQSQLGDWQGSVYSTSLAVAALKNSLQPNLNVQALESDLASVRDGDRVKLSVTVINDSALVAEPSVIELFDGDPNNGGVAIGSTAALPALQPFLPYTIDFYWDTFDLSGEHTLYAYVDRLNTIEESTKTDNIRQLVLQVEPAPGGVDLDIGGNAVSVSPSNPFSLPAALAFSTAVRNMGSELAENAVIQLWLKNSDTGETNLVDQQALSLPGRSTAVVNFVYDLNQAGVSDFVVLVDPDNVFVEAQEDNNRADVQVLTQSAIDLEVLAENISITPSPVILHQDAEIAVRISNRGTITAQNVAVRYLVQNDNGTEVIQSNTVTLEPGQSVDRTVIWRADFSGDSTFVVEADVDNLIAETNETNNVANTLLSTQQLTGSNVAVSFRDLLFSPDPGLEGFGATLEAIVVNTGTEALNTVEVSFYDGDPATNGETIGDSIVIPQIVSGESLVVQQIWTQIPDDADRQLFVLVDPNQNIAEFNEGDNQAFERYEVLSLPDFAVDSGSIIANPEFPQMGETVELSVIVNNLGKQSANNVLVRAYDGLPALGGSVLSEVTIPTLDGFSLATVNFSMMLDQSGTETFYVEVNPNTSILEKNTGNNSASRQFTLQDGDFNVTERFISPNDDGSKDATEYFFRLDDLTTVTVVVLDYLNRPIKTFNQAFNQVVSGSVIWDGRNDLNGVALDGTYRFALREEGSENYFGIARVTIDTNRSALVDALDTQWQFTRNQTCLIGEVVEPNASENIDQPRGIVYTDDNEFVFFDTFLAPFQVDDVTFNTNDKVLYPSGVYRADSDGSDVKPVISEVTLQNDTIGGTQDITRLVPSSDGANLVLSIENTEHHYQIWKISDVGGIKQRVLLHEQNATQQTYTLAGIVVLPGTGDVVIAEQLGGSYQLTRLSVVGTDVIPVDYGTVFASGSTDDVIFSSNALGDRLAMHIKPQPRDYISYQDLITNERYSLYLLNLETGANLNLGDRASAFSWSDDGSKLAVGNIALGGVVIYNKDGQQQQVFSLFGNYQVPTEFQEIYYRFIPADLPLGSPLGRFAGLDWNPDGLELAFAYEDYVQGISSALALDYRVGDSVDIGSADVEPFEISDQNGIFLADLLTNTLTRHAGIEPLNALPIGDPDPDMGECICPFSPFFCFDSITEQPCIPVPSEDGPRLSSYHVYVLNNQTWLKVDELHFDKHYSQRSFTLPDIKQYVTNERLKIKIEQVGHEEAHIDQVVLRDFKARAIKPFAAVLEERNVLTELTQADKHVVDALGKTLFLDWDASTLPEGGLSLSMVAREATLSTLLIAPFAYPASSSGYFEYTLAKKNRFQVDGYLSEKEAQHKVFETFSKPDTGHPAAMVTGFIGSDKRYLYAGLDFAVDNTIGNPADWAEIEVLVDGEWKVFRLTETDRRYGKVGFSGNALHVYPHKYYEFKIPLKKLDRRVGDTIQFRFNAYGSAGVLVNNLDLDEFGMARNAQGLPVLRWYADENWYTPDQRMKRLRWLEGSRSVLVTGPTNGASSQTVVVGFDDATVTRPILTDYTLANKRFVDVAKNGSAFGFFADTAFDRCPANSEQRGYRQLRSLLNLTADLTALRSRRAGGIILRGTASDKNFSHYELEYTDATVADDWQLLAPVSQDAVIDEQLTVWVPPDEGVYFVRLTAYDLAGNSRQVVTRTSISERPSITGLFREPTQFSPNADGVLDSVNLSFTVLEPVNLQFNVYNENEVLVRTIERSVSEIGSEQQFLWDGRDDDGNRVDDGVYTLDLQGFRYFVELDTQAPNVIDETQGLLAAIPDTRGATKEECLNYEKGCLLGLDRSIRFSATDNKSVPALVLEEQRSAGSSWRTLDLEAQEFQGQVSLSGAFSVADLSEKLYRIRATDRAGNSAVVSVAAFKKQEQVYIVEAGLVSTNILSEIEPEEFILGGASYEVPLDLQVPRHVPITNPSSSFNVIDFRTLYSPVFIRIAETVSTTLSAVNVMYRIEGEQEEFITSPVTNYADLINCPTGNSFCGANDRGSLLENREEHIFTAFWNPELHGLDPSKQYRVYIQLRDIDGNTYSSNSFVYGGIDGGIDGVFDVPPQWLDSNQQNTVTADSDEQAVSALVALLSLEPEELSKAILSVSSVSDNRYRTPVVIDSFLPNGNRSITTANNTHYYFDIGVLRPCSAYTFVATFVLKDGREFTFAKNLTTECLDLEVTFAPVLAQTCDEPPTEQVKFAMSVQQQNNNNVADFPEPVLMTLTDISEENQPVLLYSENNPEIGTRYEYVFDLSTLDVSNPFRTVRLELIDEDGRVTQKVSRVPIVKEKASLEITSPVQGQTYCALDYNLGEIGGAFKGLPVEGSVFTPYKVYETQCDLQLDGFENSHAGCNRKEIIEFSNGVPTTVPAINYLYDAENNVSQLNGRISSVLRREFSFNGESFFQEAAGRDVLFSATITNWSGGLQCESFDIEIDGIVEDLLINAVENDNGEFVYQTGGASEEQFVHWDYSSTESTNVTINIYEAIPSGGSFSQSDTVVATPFSNVAVGIAGNRFSWDGYHDGSLLPDGNYFAVFVVKDTCGNNSAAAKLFEIDNTVPEVQFTYPTSLDSLGLTIEPRVFIEEKNIYQTELFLLDQGGPVALNIELSHELKGVNDFTDWSPGVWNTLGLTGEHTLGILVEDDAGNTSEALIIITLPDRENLITLLESSPRLFSPNADAKLDNSTINFEFAQDALASIRIVDGTNVIRTLAENQTYPLGRHSLVWDGLDDAGGLVTNGDYEVEVEAQNATNPTFVQNERFGLSVDTTDPQIIVNNLTDGVLGIFADEAGAVILGNIIEDNFEAYSVIITETPLAPDSTVVGGGEIPPVSELTTININDLEEEGSYQLTVQASDTARNVANLTFELLVDRTPPVVELSLPEADTYFNLSDTTIAVEGSIEEINFDSLEITLASVLTPEAAVITEEFDSLPMTERITTLSLTGIQDGEYRLTVKVIDKAGLTGTVTRNIVVDNTVPDVSLLSSGTEYITEPLSIIGTAQDDNLVQFELAYVQGENPIDAEYTNLVFSKTGVDNGVLYDWDSLPEDGVYTLRLTATDKAKNANAVTTVINVDTHAPQTPQLTSAVLNREDGSVRVLWEAVPDEDLKRYIVRRNGAGVNVGDLLETEWVNDNVAEGQYRYTVSAIDHAGLESDESEAIELLVDFTPPEIALSKPANNDVLSGLVDIRGSVLGNNGDLKSYSVAVGVLDETLSVIATASLETVGGELAQWNSVGLDETKTYTIELSAEDQSGNTSLKTVDVTIDNTAPEIPLNLAAVANGNDISLSWDGGPSDVEGYLLFRNDRLVNAGGVVIGDLAPYAIEQTNYEDNGVVDGTHNYVLLALDAAGNMSEPAGPVTIVVDERTPVATIVDPETGAVFENSLQLVATVEDEDVAIVAFEYRSQGSADWQSILADTREPFVVQWDTSALAYEDFEIRAVATDVNNNIDPAPGVLSIVKQDITSPAMVQGLAVITTGDVASLSWDASTEPDVAGYRVYRTLLGSEQDAVLLTPSVINTTSFTDTGLLDGRYDYHVLALDLADNASLPSVQVAADIFAPTANYPLSPTLLNQVQFTGIVAVGDVTIDIDVESNGSVVTERQVQADSAGFYQVDALPLSVGDNLIRISAQLGGGSTSKEYAFNLRRSELPAVVTGVSAGLNNDESAIDVVWAASAETDVLGYRVYRADTSIANKITPPITSAIPSVGHYDSNDELRLYDRNFDASNFWAPVESNVSVELQLSELQLTEGITLHWSAVAYRATRFNVSVWDGEKLHLINQVVNTEGAEITPVVFDQPYRTDRIVIDFIDVACASCFQPLRVKEVVFNVVELANTIDFFADVPDDGFHDYSVAAINTDGFEGAVSEKVTSAFGDVAPPASVTVSTTVTGSNVLVSWTQSTSSDVALYRIYRDGELINNYSNLASLEYLDADLSNDTYTYSVRAVDDANNVSESSNEAVAIVMAQILAAPSNLSLAVVPESGHLALAWEILPEPVPASYRVYRSEDNADQFSLLAEGIEQPNWLDSDVELGRTYFYYAVAVDDLANESAASNQVSGIAQDSIAPEPPLLSAPARSGSVLYTELGNVVVAGQAEPASTVKVVKEGQVLSTVVAASEITINGILVEQPTSVMESETGSLAAIEYVSHDHTRLYYLNGTHWELIQDATRGDEAFTEDLLWIGDRLLIGVGLSAQQPLKLLDPASNTIEVLPSIYEQSGEIIEALGYRPDKGTIIVTSRSDSYNGLAELDIRTGNLNSLSLSNWNSWGLEASISPDSRFMARALVGRIEVYDFDTQQLATYNIGGVVPALTDWSYDNSRLLLVYRNTQGDFQIGEFDLATETLSPLVSIADKDITNAVWSPFGDQILVQVRDLNDISVQLFDLSMATFSMVFEANNSLRDVYWSERNVIVFHEYLSNLYSVTLPGRFTSELLPVSYGEHDFTAFAEDAASNIGASSEAAVVIRTEPNLPDISVSLSIDPLLPNKASDVIVTAVVSNQNEDTLADTDLSVTVINSDGSTEQLALNQEVPGLNQGDSVSYSLQWKPQEAGDYVLSASVDTGNTVIERDESNNNFSVGVPVVDKPLPLVDVALAPSVDGSFNYSYNANVEASISLVNAGDLFNGHLVISVVDDNGLLVVDLLSELIVDLAYADDKNYPVTWPVNGSISGQYSILARVTSNDELLVSESEKTLQVNEDLLLLAGVVTDLPSYDANRDVQFSATVANNGGNGVFAGGSLRLTVRNSASDILFEQSQSVSAMLPGESGIVRFNWNTASYAVGAYSSTLEVFNADESVSLAVSLVNFDIRAGEPQLVGGLRPSTEQVGQGRELIVNISALNLGNADISAAQLKVDLLDVQNGDVVTLTEIIERDLMRALELNEGVSFDTSALTIGDYQLRLSYEVSVLGTDYSKVLAAAAFKVVDITAPEVVITRPEDGGVINSLRVPVEFVAEDTESDVASVALSIAGGGFIFAEQSLFDTSIFIQRITDLGEGEYEVTFRSTDTVGNTSNPRVSSFTVDNTPPTLTVTGVEEGVYYDAPVSAVVTVEDSSLKVSDITLNGDAYSSGSLIEEDGEYQLVVDAVDLAGNATREIYLFGIDSAAAIINITGVDDDGAYSLPVTPQIEVTETNVQSQVITLNGDSFASGTEVSQEGSYQLIVAVTDIAGNVSEVMVNFEIDQTAPAAPVISSPNNNADLNISMVNIEGTAEPDTLITMTGNGSTNIASVRQDGQFLFEQVELNVGTNTFVFNVTDRAGNVSEQTNLTLNYVESADVTLNGFVSVEPSVLIWAPPQNHIHHPLCSFGWHWGHHSGYPHYDHDAEAVSELFIETYVDAGIQHEIVRTRHEFIVALRAQKHNVIVIANLDENHALPYVWRGLTSLELRAAVASGSGLVVFNDKPYTFGHMKDILGARVRGHARNAEHLTFEEQSPVGSVQWDVSGDASRLRMAGGQPVGNIEHFCSYVSTQICSRPAVSLHTYGKGDTALIPFNPAIIDDRENAKHLIEQLSRYATPDSQALIAGNRVQVNWLAEDLPTSSSFSISSDVSEGVSFVEAIDGQIVLNVAGWEFSTETNAGNEVSAVIQLPVEDGNYQSAAEIYQVVTFSTTPLATGVVELSIDRSLAELEADLISAIEAIDVSGWRKRQLKRHALYFAHHAQSLSRENIWQLEWVIFKMAIVIHDLKKLGDIDTLILASEILRSYHSEWSTYVQGE